MSYYKYGNKRKGKINRNTGVKPNHFYKIHKIKMFYNLIHSILNKPKKRAF